MKIITEHNTAARKTVNLYSLLFKIHSFSKDAETKNVINMSGIGLGSPITRDFL